MSFPAVPYNPYTQPNLYDISEETVDNNVAWRNYHEEPSTQPATSHWSNIVSGDAYPPLPNTYSQQRRPVQTIDSVHPEVSIETEETHMPIKNLQDQTKLLNAIESLTINMANMTKTMELLMQMMNNIISVVTKIPESPKPKVSPPLARGKRLPPLRIRKIGNKVSVRLTKTPPASLLQPSDDTLRPPVDKLELNLENGNRNSDPDNPTSMQYEPLLPTMTTEDKT